MKKTTDAAARRFRAAETPIPTANKRTYLNVAIFDGDVQIGEYVRNYGSYGASTFEPFEVDGQWFALYSKNYTCTRVMTLPDCADIGGEETDSKGFCPVELWVPRYRSISWPSGRFVDGRWRTAFEINADQALSSSTAHEATEVSPWRAVDFAFVSGCVWGDDWSWKLEVIDLSDAARGQIRRSAKFGYCPLQDGISLNDSVDVLAVEDGQFACSIKRMDYRDVATGETWSGADFG